MKKLVPLILGVTLLTGGITLLQPQAAEATKSAKQATLGKAPDFTLQTLEGKETKLSDFNGKVRIVDFWATWCPPCRGEIPDFIALQKAYRAKGLEVIGVSVDQGGPDVVKKFAKEQGITYTMLMANDKVVADFGGIRGIPTTFVIDRSGNIIKKYVGATSKETFEADIKSLL